LEVSLSPNPTATNFNLLVHSSLSGDVLIRVIDINGKIVHTIKGITEQQYKFGSLLAPGLYMIEVRQGDEVKILKGIKVR
jgi:hypothetical protein